MENYVPPGIAMLRENKEKKKALTDSLKAGDITYSNGLFTVENNDEINWETDKIVSFSQYAKYKKCPKSWELRYVRKHKVPRPGISMVYGTAMHEVIQLYLKTLYATTIKAANELDLHASLMFKLKSEYAKAVEDNNNVHFSTHQELSEYYVDGCAILNFLKKNRTKYFNTKGTQLMAIELNILDPAVANRPTVKLQTFLDLVFYNKVKKRYLIVDIKTSKSGWNEWKRKDKNVTDQLLIYKYKFCEKYNIDINDVDVEYFILRNKIDPDSMWPIPRISEFKPSSGKVSLKRAMTEFRDFIDKCFDTNGQYIDKSYPATAGKNYWNCKFCEYSERDDLCPQNNRILDDV